jgi:hypothetical protein
LPDAPPVEPPLPLGEGLVAGVGAGVVTTGVVEAGVVDTGVVEPGVVEPGAVEAGVVDAGVVEPGAVEAPVVAVGAVEVGAVRAGAVTVGVCATPMAGTVPCVTAARCDGSAFSSTAVRATIPTDCIATPSRASASLATHACAAVHGREPPAAACVPDAPGATPLAEAASAGFGCAERSPPLASKATAPVAAATSVKPAAASRSRRRRARTVPSSWASPRPLAELELPVLKLDIRTNQPTEIANLRSVLWRGSAERGEIIRTMSRSDGRPLRCPRFGAAALACVLSALLWTVVLAPAAHADSQPQLTDASTGSHMTAGVGDSVTLKPGSYDLDPVAAGLQERWYDCNSPEPTPTLVGAVPANCTAITPAPTSPYTVASSDQGSYITVYETDPNPVAAEIYQNPSNTLAVPAAPPPPPAPTNIAPPSIAGATTSGSTLSAVPGLWTGSGNNYSYSWERCSVDYSICTAQSTAATYQLKSDDVNDDILLRQTATNPGGSVTVASSPFGPISTPSPTLPAATETTLAITPAGVVAGQTATLTATVTSATSEAPPAGVITFEHAGTAIPGCASLTTHPSGASATVMCQTAFAGSSSTFGAVFTPAPGSQVTSSNSATGGFVLGHAATVSTMIVPTHWTLGKRLELTTKVAPQAGTTGVSPTGDVVFLDGEKAIKGCATALSDGVAHCALNETALGTHSISAVYLGDGNFSGSSTHVHTLAIVVPKPTGYVSSLMSWTFDFEPQYTRVTALAVTSVQPGLTISVGCSGSGCPHRGYIDTVKRAACGKADTCRSVNLAERFTRRRLGVGTTLTVRLTHPGWLGKYYSFVVRGGRAPKIDIACLAVGQAKPGAGCTPH